MAANESEAIRTAESIVHTPAELVAGVGEKSRSLLVEVGSMFWFIANTIGETVDRIRRGRVPFRAASFFLYTERAGVASVPLVAMVSFFLGLTMALLTGYQLERYGTERLVPGLVAIAFTTARSFAILPCRIPGKNELVGLRPINVLEVV